jgi:hypothetical protein
MRIQRRLAIHQEQIAMVVVRQFEAGQPTEKGI